MSVKIPFSQVEAAITSDEYIGFCLACGEEVYGVEPDARKYECESCGCHEVYGAEEVLMMGQCDDDEGSDLEWEE